MVSCADAEPAEKAITASAKPTICALCDMCPPTLPARPADGRYVRWFVSLASESFGMGMSLRLERQIRSTDPDVETKAAYVIGLYLDPRQHAVVFCVDSDTASISNTATFSYVFGTPDPGAYQRSHTRPRPTC